MRTFQMVFKNPALLDSMLSLRRQGWTYESLALLFKVDHSSIYKACKIRHIIRPRITLSIYIPGIIDAIGIKPLKEKTYQDYLEEDRYRNRPNLKRLTTTV